MKKAVFVRVTTAVLFLCMVLSFACTNVLTRGESVVLDAMQYLEVPYVLGTSGPDTFDCSGLLRFCYAKVGLKLPHSAEELGTVCSGRTITDTRRLHVGDIVCFDTVRDRDPSDHVGIWIGGNRFIHASSSQKKVMISELTGYYAEHFSFARRLMSPYF